MLFIILGIIVFLCIILAVYTYITGHIIFTGIKGYKYGHLFAALAILLTAGGFYFYYTGPAKTKDNTFTPFHLVVRSNPGDNENVLGYLYPGQTFRVISKGNHWAKVAGGKKEKFGWVFADDLKSVSDLDAWKRNERRETLTKNDSIIAANAGGKDISIKKNDYEEAKILLQQLHQAHGLKYIDRSHDRAYFDDYLWTRRMSKEQKQDYLEFLSDFLGYEQNNKRKVYIRAINFRTGELLGTYIPGIGAKIDK